LNGLIVKGHHYSPFNINTFEDREIAVSTPSKRLIGAFSMSIYQNLAPLGYYVYQYIDPRNNLPFYIGKGKEKRYQAHLFETAKNTENLKKYAYIQGLRNKGLMPTIEIVLDNLSEEQAYHLEESLIIKYGRKDIDPDGILTNICLGNKPPRQIWSDERKQEQSALMSSIVSQRKPGGKYEDGYNRIMACQKRLVENGTAIFYGMNNPVHEKVRQGLHHWLGSGSNKERLAKGTHPSQIKVQCPVCQKIGSSSNMVRWHFDNCKELEKLRLKQERQDSYNSQCPHCLIKGKIWNLRRTHFDKCSFKCN